MDVSGLVVTGLGICFELASTLYSYGKDVKGARRDIQSLSTELFGLIGALEHFKLQNEQLSAQAEQSSQPPPYVEIDNIQSKTKHTKEESAKDGSQENIASVLEQTVSFLRELQQSLKIPPNRLNAAIHFIKWPLRESEVNRHLNRLERVKTFFILSMVTDEVDGSHKLANEIAALQTRIRDASIKQQAIESRNEHKAMMDWLCPVDPSAIRRSIEKVRAPGTGAWFIKSEAFQTLSTTVESSCFWLNGITGAGKTTLITAAIDEFLANHEGLFDFAYFYSSFSNDESLYTQNVLGSILAQILTDSDAVYEQARAKYLELSARSKFKPTRLDVDALVELIIQHARYRKRLCIVLDGINECNDPYELLQALGKILTATSVQLLVSSMNERGIERSIARMPKVYHITVSPQSIRPDVNLLVHSALETHARLKALPRELKKDIIIKLTDRAEGMFRWVQCQLDLLSRLRTPGAIKRALESLPPTLDKTYESLLERIDGEEDRALARQILQVLAFSLRPLYLDEVCTMLQITPGMAKLDESKCLTHPKDILDICGSLLKYNEKTRMVTLAHHSVKMYLTTKRRNSPSYFNLDAQDAHRFIATLCLTFLSFDDFSVERSEPSSKLYEDYAFLEYATFNWALHMQEVADLREPIWSTLRAFLLSDDEGRRNFANWVQILIPDSKNAGTTSPLYYAASYGLPVVVKYLLSMGVDMEAHGGRGGATPINIAAYRGHLEVVKLLDEHGADPFKPDTSSGLNAVQWAAYQRQLDVLEYFEEKGYLRKTTLVANMV